VQFELAIERFKMDAAYWDCTWTELALAKQAKVRILMIDRELAIALDASISISR